MQENGLPKQALVDDTNKHIEKLSEHFHKVLNVTRGLREEIIGMLPDFSHAASSVDWGPPTEATEFNTFYKISI